MFIVYDPKDGRILQTTVGPEPETYGKILDADGRVWVFQPDAVVDITKDYFDHAAKRVVPRPIMTIATDGKFIRNVPTGCAVTILLDGTIIAKERVEDGEIDFDPPNPGAYRAWFECWPYIPHQMDLPR